MERITFEEALKKLEIIVSKLEENTVTLEDSVNLYEEGMKLSKYCTEILEKAELRIEKVNDQSSQ
jgi:exodeoxyribonuclease VII small subunit